MGVEHAAVVHPVEMIAREDQVIVRVVPAEVPCRLPHRVCRSLKPVRAVGRLFRRDDIDEAVRKRIHAIGLRHVMIQRRRVELRQHENAPQLGMEAVADRHVDETVLSADWHRRLRALLGEGKQAGSLAAAQDDREYVVHRYVMIPMKNSTSSKIRIATIVASSSSPRTIPRCSTENR